jgi:hypothetical protein
MAGLFEGPALVEDVLVEVPRAALSDSFDAQHAGARRRLTALRGELAPRVPTLYEQGKRYFQDEDLEKALVVWRNALLIAPDDQHESVIAPR